MTEKKSSSASGPDDVQPALAPESSIGYLAAGSASEQEQVGQGSSAASPSASTAKGSSAFALVGLALLVGASLALFLVRESSWLAQKILKEQQTQEIPASGGPAPDIAAETTPKTQDAEPSAAPPNLAGAPPSRSVGLVRGIDPLLVQRLAQIQQWAVLLRTLPAGPRDPSRDLASVLSAGREPVRETNKGLDPAGPVTSPSVPETSSPATGPDSAVPVEATSASGPLMQWLGQAASVTGSFLASLVRVQQVSEPSLSGQTQAFFAQVDQQAQSHLMAARLMLIQGQSSLVIGELEALLALLKRYYEANDARLIVLRGEVVALRDALKDPV
ncbi:MAG: hypothetical protein ACO3DD_07190 [Burkholderiaceae bacterium]